MYMSWLDFCWSNVQESKSTLTCVFFFFLTVFSVAAPFMIIGYGSFYFWGLVGLLEGLAKILW